MRCQGKQCPPLDQKHPFLLPAISRLKFSSAQVLPPACGPNRERASSASSGARFDFLYRRRRLSRASPSAARLESENAFQGLSLRAPQAKQPPVAERL